MLSFICYLFLFLMQENPTFISQKEPINVGAPQKKEKATAFILSLVALVIVVFFGGIMTVLSFLTKNSINTTIEKITQSDEKISQYQQKKEIIIASFMQDNNLMKSIDIKRLVDDFRSAATDAGVQFQGFSVKDDTITTNLIATSITNRDAVSSIIAMMESYAQNNQQKAFALEPILSISGTPKARTTPVTFKIIPVNEGANDVVTENQDSSN